MILAQALSTSELLVVVLYLLVLAYLGWLGYRQTKTAADYLLAGRKAHPVIMAMSYGATFISTSAIVGFGGVAAMFGMSLLWLTFLNIFVGIFIAFVFLGGPTRRIGHRLDAHTFPELLGRRFQSKFVQVFAGLVIFCFMPLYAAAVLIGGTEYITTYFGMNYTVALLVFAVITAAYVIAGGLKAVMFTDALQGTIMFVGMGVLLIWAYALVGGVNAGHEQLAQMATTPSLFKGIGQQGWTAMPKFGFGDKQYDLWWIVVSTIVTGVGIGVLAQPQLAVRFMTVKDKKQLHRAVGVGGVFILMMTGVAFTVGTISNVYFFKREEIKGKVVSVSENVGVTAKKERDIEAKIPCDLLHIDTNGDGEADTIIVARGYDVIKDGKVVLPGSKLMPVAQVTEAGTGMTLWPITGEGAPTATEALLNKSVIAKPCATAFTRAVVQQEPGVYAFNTDSIIPTFITSAMPKWFGLIFLLTLLSAAMSTMSSQYHASGTAIGRDVYMQLSHTDEAKREDRTIIIVRLGIIVGLVLAVIVAQQARGGYIVARATAIFFGLCASSFLPTFVGGLFFRRATRSGAIASMIVGFLVTGLWLLFIKDAEARAIGFCHVLTGKHSLLLNYPNWPVVDPIVIALPISAIVMIVVSLMTKPSPKDHLEKCYGRGEFVPALANARRG